MVLRCLSPTREHARALESVQLKAARMILSCPSRASSDVVTADLGVQLLSSRKDITKLKGQHRLHGLSAGKLERALYDRDWEAQCRGRGRNRRTWSQAVGSIRGTLPNFSMGSISMPRRESALELYSAVHDKDRASFLGALASKPELVLFQRIYKGPGFREYLQRNTQGQQAAQIRFQLRSRTSMLRQHDNRFRD